MAEDKQDPFKKSIGVYLDIEVIDALDSVADSQMRSRNWIINKSLADALGIDPRFYIAQRPKEKK